MTTAFWPLLCSEESVAACPSSIMITAPSTIILFVANAREHSATDFPFGAKKFDDIAAEVGVPATRPDIFSMCKQGRKVGKRIIFT